MQKKEILKKAAILGTAIFFVNYIAMKFYWYSSIWWFDMPMHFFGGIFLASISIFIIYHKFISFNLKHQILFVGVSVFAIGVGWEVFEIFIDKFITLQTFNSLDTTSDILFDLSGGFFLLLLFLRSEESKNSV